jgi:hypothetical protein
MPLQYAPKSVVRAATEEKVELSTSNGTAASLGSPTNMLDFDELSDIIR